MKQTSSPNRLAGCVVGNCAPDCALTRLCPPIASFTRECSFLTCRFDASGSSDSDGHVVKYAWSFGDGTTASTSDAVVSHSYAPGTYTVGLTVTDNAGATSSTASAVIVLLNTPPVAAFESVCDSLGPVCAFNADGMDSDGSIAAYAWDFGDGTSAVGRNVTRTYAAAGTYAVTLTVTDNYGATNSRTASVTAVQVILHVSDLDGARDVQKRYWTASVTIRIHDADHRLVNAQVEGVWSTGESAVCYIDSSSCVFTVLPTSTLSVTFTMRSVSLGLAVYDAARNHDVDGDTNGTSITITRR